MVWSALGYTLEELVGYEVMVLSIARTGLFPGLFPPAFITLLFAY